MVKLRKLKSLLVDVSVSRFATRQAFQRSSDSLNTTLKNSSC